MKKILSVAISVIIITLSLAVSVNAEDNVSSQENASIASATYVEYFDDGYYFVTTVTQSPSSRATTYTKDGHKTISLFNSSDELQWEYTLVGTFKVTTGVSAVCTNSTFEYKIYNDSWSLTAHDNSYSENAAYGTATFKKKVLFITTSTKNIDVRVLCDVYGNIS